MSALSLLNTFVLFYNQQLIVFSYKFVTGRIFVYVGGSEIDSKYNIHLSFIIVV